MAPEHPNVHVIVLAAGRGKRMGARGDEIPKWLLELDGRTIAERQLEAAEGVASVSVVTGHADATIARFLADHGRSDVRTIFNPQYEPLNNWYSLLVGLRELDLREDDRMVLFNSDLYAEPDWYAEFVRSSASTAEESLIAVDVERHLTDESMKVAARDGAGALPLLERIGKVGIDDPIGEYVGMLMARGDVLGALRDKLASFEGRPEAANEWYEGAVGYTAAEGVPWNVWATPGSHWVEIDDDADYSNAEQLAQRA